MSWQIELPIDGADAMLPVGVAFGDG